MARTITPARTEPAGSAGGDRRRIRLALIGAILLLTGYALLSTFRTVGEAVLNSHLSPYPRPSEISANEWLGVSGAITFAVIGTGLLMLALNLKTGPLTCAFGVIGAAGYLLSAGGVRTMYSLIAANLTEIGADISAQTSALWAVNIVNGGSLLLATGSTAAWALLLGLHGPRAHVIGRPSAVVLVLCSGVVLVAVVFFALFAAQILFVPIWIAVVLSLARRMRKTSADA